jgi:hypothetical protein
MKTIIIIIVVYLFIGFLIFIWNYFSAFRKDRVFGWDNFPRNWEWIVYVLLFLTLPYIPLMNFIQDQDMKRIIKGHSHPSRGTPSNYQYMAARKNPQCSSCGKEIPRSNPEIYDGSICLGCKRIYCNECMAFVVKSHNCPRCGGNIATLFAHYLQ